MDYVALKSEIDNDPNGYGYKPSGSYRDDMAITDRLNQARAEIQIPRGRVPMYELIACINKAEYAALSAADKDIVQMIARLDEVDTTCSPLFSMVASIFPGLPAEGVTPTETGQALLSAIFRSGSRAEQLFGVGVTIGHLDVAKALRG